MITWFEFIISKNFAYFRSGFYLNKALGYFEGYGILVKKRESVSRRNYVFLAILLAILHDLSLLSKIFFSTLDQRFI